MSHNENNLVPFTKNDPRRINKPKGAISLSTHIQNLLNDDKFEANILDPKIGLKAYKGTPAKALIQVAIIHALNGDAKWADWLAKYGFGTKITHASDPENPIGSIDNKLLEDYHEFLRQNTKK